MTADGVRGLPPEAERIVQRWNPEGLRRHGAGRPAIAGRVCVVAVRGIDARRLIADLETLEPESVAFTDSADGAAAVLMVLDAASVLGREELTALDAAAASVDRVVFTMVGTGRHRDWPSVRRRDGDLLRAHSLRYAEARIVPDAEPGRLLAELVHAASGEPEDITGRNDARGRETLLAQTRRLIAATAESVRDGDTAATLRVRRARLVADRDGGRGERLAQLRGDVQRARVGLLHEAGSRVRSVSTTARSEIERAGRKELARFPARLTGLIGEVAEELDAAIDSRLEELVSRSGIVGFEVVARGPAEPPPPGPEPRHRGVEDRMMVVVGASAGVGLGRLVVSPISMVPALDIATIPVTLVLGGSAAWWLTRARRLVAERTHQRQWVADTTAHLRSQLEQRVLGRLLETEAELGAHIIADCRRRTLAVDEELAAIDTQLRDLAAQRSGRLASCERDHAALGRVLAVPAPGMEPIGPHPRPTT
ncbi:hypothetical protein ERC79_08850 [Rhodococcus sp. ABRD24]|uniref:hypothetical protein n=1 Tax=Rhodococcus sp. ABRD24 TaxID=2507582 RepID=UPI00103BB04F|nr:hypothetical protein [Rhodococcus sp. ABRD24]QBJ96069.1 hypothetical protein ERC79_08850 [Rhodococcus sp. ABRD24]